MPDICDLILDDHEIFRRRFAELDVERRSSADVLRRLWEPLAEHLERHANAEEEVFYPSVLKEAVSEAEHETGHAIRDHNKIRDAVRRAGEEEPGSEAWWAAVDDAREENSEHMAEEERGPLAAFRQDTAPGVRSELGLDYVGFNNEHAGGRGVDTADKDPDQFIEEHSRG